MCCPVRGMYTQTKKIQNILALERGRREREKKKPFSLSLIRRWRRQKLGFKVSSRSICLALDAHSEMTVFHAYEKNITIYVQDTQVQYYAVYSPSALHLERKCCSNVLFVFKPLRLIIIWWCGDTIDDSRGQRWNGGRAEGYFAERRPPRLPTMWSSSGSLAPPRLRLKELQGAAKAGVGSKKKLV